MPTSGSASVGERRRSWVIGQVPSPGWEREGRCQSRPHGSTDCFSEPWVKTGFSVPNLCHEKLDYNLIGSSRMVENRLLRYAALAETWSQKLQFNKLQKKRFAEWRLILTKRFPTKWQRKKSSHVRSAETLWTLSRLRGTVSRPAFPPTVLSTCLRPTLPHFRHIPPGLQETLCSPPCSVHSKGSPLDSPHWLMKTRMDRREGVGSGGVYNTWRRRETSKTCDKSDELKIAPPLEYFA